MRRLVVKDFSCIKNANLELSRLTVIIGPQASGKSVLSKLAYFFSSLIVGNATRISEKNVPFQEYRASIAVEFAEWFPPSAWGAKRFTIEFFYGNFRVRVIRRTSGGKLLDSVSVTFQDDFRDFYNSLRENVAKYVEKAEQSQKVATYEAQINIREIIRSSTQSWFEGDLSASQIFVPAGRSFFTSVGKTLVAFEQARILDPVTLSFGRRFSALRENGYRRAYVHGRSYYGPLGRVLFEEILGGSLKRNGEKDYIETTDKRLIPLSALSSGQQELLPLAMLLADINPSDSGVPPRYWRELRSWICIEEPEAHLFPRAQNKLVEVLAAIVGTKRSPTEMLITTHSPYVLSKLNNLIKAGSIASKRGKGKLIASLYPLHSWLPKDLVRAYALVDNVLQPIIDEDGLIAADYLDDVSGDIAREFSNLLKIELSK